MQNLAGFDCFKRLPRMWGLRQLGWRHGLYSAAALTARQHDARGLYRLSAHVVLTSTSACAVASLACDWTRRLCRVRRLEGSSMIEPDPVIDAGIDAVIAAYVAHGWACISGRGTDSIAGARNLALTHLNALIAHLPEDDRREIIWYAHEAGQLALTPVV